MRMAANKTDPQKLEGLPKTSVALLLSQCKDMPQRRGKIRDLRRRMDLSSNSDFTAYMHDPGQVVNPTKSQFPHL